MKRFSLLFLLGLVFTVATLGFCLEPSAKDVKSELIVFFSPGCHHCQEVRAKIMPQIEKEFGKRIFIDYRDTNNIETYKTLVSLREQYDPKLVLELPIFFFQGKFINGTNDVLANLERVLSGGNGVGAGKVIKEANLVDIFKRFKIAGVTLAGLEDGINPCAFTVIVFFISFLALQGYRRRELAVIGLTFIFAVFLTYLLVGVGIFNFLYRLKSFWLVIKTVNYGIGALSIFLGACALYDFFKYKKTGDSEGLMLQLPKSVKNQIHSVIGMHYRKTKAGGSVAVAMPRLISSAFITGFLVSLLEAVCTGQMYLPTITFIFKTTPLKLQAGLYLLLYNIMFVVPLFAVFIFALLGATSADFANFMKKHMGMIKISMAILFFALGAFLIWRG